MKYDAILNLNFDDVHPESSRNGIDCGGDREKGVFRYFKKIWKRYPEVKITLFVTPNWIDRSNAPFPLKQIKKFLGLRYSNTWPVDKFNLTKHTEWCEWLNSFENFEVAVHGLYHHRDGEFHSQEFQDAGYEECIQKLQAAERIFQDSGLKHVKGFRPPGWGVSNGLFKALKDLNYLFISASGDFNTPVGKDSKCRSAGVKGLPLIYPSEYKGLINIPQNWDIGRSDIKRALDIIRYRGIISAKGHITNAYGRDFHGNGLTPENFERIMSLLEELEKYNIRHAKMSEIAECCKRGVK